MPGSPKKNKTKPAYETGKVDPEIVEAQEKDAEEGHDQREALLKVIKKSVKAKE